MQGRLSKVTPLKNNTRWSRVLGQNWQVGLTQHSLVAMVTGGFGHVGAAARLLHRRRPVGVGALWVVWP